MCKNKSNLHRRILCESNEMCAVEDESGMALNEIMKIFCLVIVMTFWVAVKLESVRLLEFIAGFV